MSLLAGTPIARADGIVVPVVTPANRRGELDEASLFAQCEHLLQAGVSGLFVLGTTGEGAFLPTEERVRAVKVASEAVAGTAALFVGLLDPSARRSAGLVKRLDGADVTAFVVTTPYYLGSKPGEIYTHFLAMRQEVGTIPVVAYNIPHVTGVGLSFELTRALANDGIISGIKDSGTNQFHLRRLVEIQDEMPEFFVMTGSEVMVDVALRLGARGAVPGLANVVPAPYVQLYQASIAGDHDLAERIQKRLIQFYLSMVGVGTQEARRNSTSGISAFKSALQTMGLLDTRSVLPPLIPLDDAEAAEIARHLGAFSEPAGST